MRNLTFQGTDVLASNNAFKTTTRPLLSIIFCETKNGLGDHEYTYKLIV